ncbi:MAG: hypothetical protein ACKVRP_05295 [Bacteroidota bacterium]
MSTRAVAFATLPTPVRQSSITLLYLVVALIIFAMWVWSAETVHTSLNGDPRSKLSDLIHGRAHNPFVQRALVPLLTRAVHQILPATLTGDLELYLFSIPKVKKEMLRLGWEEEYFVESLVALSWAFIALAAFPFAVQALWKAIYSTSEFVTAMVPVIALLSLPPFFHVGTHYVYDFPSLFLFTAVLVCVVRRAWWLSYIPFLLGCLNKETIIFASLTGIILYWHDRERTRMARHVAVQFLLFIVVKLMLMQVFSGNPGTSAEFALYANIHQLLLGYDAVPLTMTATLVGLIGYRFRTKPVVLQKLLWLALPFFLLLMLFGRIGELRVMYEIVPVVLFLILHTLFFDVFKFRYAPVEP